MVRVVKVVRVVRMVRVVRVVGLFWLGWLGALPQILLSCPFVSLSHLLSSLIFIFLSLSFSLCLFCFSLSLRSSLSSPLRLLWFVLGRGGCGVLEGPQWILRGESLGG